MPAAGYAYAPAHDPMTKQKPHRRAKVDLI